jgi:hypothetical protein
VASSLKLDKSQVHLKLVHGMEKKHSQRIKGRWPGSAQKSSYPFNGGVLKMSSSDEILSPSLEADEELYLREVELSLRIRSRKHFLSYGAETGSPVLTLSDGRGILRFRRNKKMRQLIRFGRKGHTITISWQFNILLAAGESVSLDPIRIRGSESPLQPPIASGNPSPFSRNLPRTVWTTPIKGALQLKALEDNLSWMEKERFFFDLIRLEGLHGKIGDWEDLTSEFRGKIGFINRRIEHNGMIPSLAFSPFLTELGSETARLHPEWLTRELKSDSPLVCTEGNRKVHVLDYTQEEVQDHLVKLLDLFRLQWGFKALHLRSFSPLFLPGRHRDMSLEGGHIMLNTLKRIRETVGKDFFISAEEIPLITEDGLISAVSLPYSISSRRKSARDIHKGIRRILNHQYSGPYPWLFCSGPYPLPEEKETIHPQAGESLRQMMLLNGGILNINQDLISLTDDQKGELRDLIPSFRRFTDGRIHIFHSSERNSPCIVFNSSGYLGVCNLEKHKNHQSLNMEEMRQIIYKRSGSGSIKEGKTDMKTGELSLILPPYGSRIFKF